MRSKSVILATAVSIALFSAGCSKKTDTSASQVLHFRMGSHDLYIPRAYVRFAGTSVGNQSALIHALYPGAAPIEGNENELWKTGRSQEFIMILFNDLGAYPEYNLQRGVNARMAFTKATKIVGTQYGLIYQSQPDGIKNDFDELWLEKRDGELVSFISCRKKYAEGIVPHCQQLFRDQNFSYEITFDKRKLPQWRLIQDNVLALVQSFQSEQDARNFLNKQLVNSIEE